MCYYSRNQSQNMNPTTAGCRYRYYCAHVLPLQSTSAPHAARPSVHRVRTARPPLSPGERGGRGGEGRRKGRICVRSISR
uniref:Uncharacterized protein n=1 Tax=Oryza sativa subsp. japonica TaxID=39947 RepID=Q69J42_ORYSJ|nr:hypothetical protein [Oryza sativa Japonica Group]BAD32019.1 hypothetical protein [Oryza sativa Japonica Group]